MEEHQGEDKPRARYVGVRVTEDLLRDYKIKLAEIGVTSNYALENMITQLVEGKIGLTPP